MTEASSSSSSSSSSNKQPHQLPYIFNTTAAPPPTPSTTRPGTSSHHLSTTSSADAAVDALSRLLHRLPPSLSLPTRNRYSSPPTCPPLISLPDANPDGLLSASSTLGFFQLANHSIPSELANSAELETLSLFELTREQKESYFCMNWPLGFDDDVDGTGESFCLDATCPTETSELSLARLREFSRALQEVGLGIIEMLSQAVGFGNPLKGDPTRFCSLMWIHEGQLAGGKPVVSGGSYPFIVRLQYQIRSQKYSLLTDSGWITALPNVDSVLVTIGDIARVWSNGKLSKVRGRPLPCSGEGNNNSGSAVSMSLLITLPLESTVISPLLPMVHGDDQPAGKGKDGEGSEDQEKEHGGEKRMFKSFPLEDYAWRVYHEYFLFKDPLESKWPSFLQFCMGSFVFCIHFSCCDW